MQFCPVMRCNDDAFYKTTKNPQVVNYRCRTRQHWGHLRIDALGELGIHMELERWSEEQGSLCGWSCLPADDAHLPTDPSRSGERHGAGAMTHAAFEEARPLTRTTATDSRLALRWSGHRGGEAIAQAVDGLDPLGISGVVTKLAPQPLNVFLQRVSGLGVVRPDAPAN